MKLHNCPDCTHEQELRRACDCCLIARSMHHVGPKHYCCSCHIRRGGTPADWHNECMVEYEKYKKVRRKFED